MFNLPQIDADTTAWFHLDSKKYEIHQFKIGFGQSIDHKGQPQDEVRGGRILLVLTQSVEESIYAWAMKSFVRKNGLILLETKTGNAPLKIEFMNAYCVAFNRVVCASGGLTTTLAISPEEILFNGVSFDNHWVK